MPRKKTMKFDVFCNCRFPWVWCHSKNKDLNMVQYDSYKTGVTAVGLFQKILLNTIAYMY